MHGAKKLSCVVEPGNKAENELYIIISNNKHYNFLCSDFFLVSK